MTEKINQYINIIVILISLSLHQIKSLIRLTTIKTLHLEVKNVVTSSISHQQSPTSLSVFIKSTRAP